MKHNWRLLDPDPQIVRKIQQQTDCSPLVARLMAIRGILPGDSAARFLTPALSHLSPPVRLPDMVPAVSRICRAIEKQEKILVFGDYDADGVTATAVMVSFLRDCGADVRYAIPYRMTDGYGLGPDFITRYARPAGVQLIITVDCGSSSGNAITCARKMGIDTVVTDHHPVDAWPEDAVAVVSSARSIGTLSRLAGVGVAFYLVMALRARLRETGLWKTRPEPHLGQLCDLVALGTVADIVPLVGENRMLTVAGLYQINTRPRPGIAALSALSGKSAPVDVNTETIAFQLAPRINAAGRLAHARMACELLLTDDPSRADRLARALCQLNTKRQALENELFDAIRLHLDRYPECLAKPVLVISGPLWHDGVVGIVASRLARTFNRPAIVISTRNGIAKGSGRSVEGIDLTAGLSQCADLLDRFGGHPQAAGLILKTANLSDFRARLESVMGTLISAPASPPLLSIDATLPLSRITPDLMAQIEQLEPFGQGNPRPVFMAEKVSLRYHKMLGGNHCQMVLERAPGNPDTLSAIWFNTADSPSPAGFDKIAFHLQWNHWNGSRKIQLVIQDAIPAKLAGRG
ncbi:single-stranded-DNA-specific exonuclease RecJ [Desulfosarcina sp. OttesenSCG-928-A07]|nr:single-stranded-DNA-specific exonuclease RecJ [Desulfosarcina sp. OttesenSCG-928-G17]MDL2328715.1 single-stranded-DNA-specific exonuclease RecJ [Desulfosarcina sp. OttesenSCG-928-A07]